MIVRGKVVTFFVASIALLSLLFPGTLAPWPPHAGGPPVISPRHPTESLVSSLSSATAQTATSNPVIATIPVGNRPVALAYDSTNNTIYVGNAGSSNISVINGSRDVVTATIPVSGIPSGMAFDPLNGLVYVTNEGGDNVTVINSTTNRVITTVPVGDRPYGIGVDSATGNVYVSNQGGSNLTVISGHTNTVTSSITTGGTYGWGVAFDDSNGYIYVSNQLSSNVSVIDGQTNTLVGSVAVAPLETAEPLGIAFDGANGLLYVANSVSYSYANVTVINGTTDRTVGSIPFPTPVESPYPGAAFDSVNGNIYVASDATSPPSITIINGSTDSVVAQIDAAQGSYLGYSPSVIAFDVANAHLYAAIEGSDSVAVINGSILYPDITSFRANPANITVGALTSLNVSVAGSPNDFGYFYSGLPPGCSSSDTNSLTCAPTKVGNYTVTVFVNNSAGNSKNSSTTLDVHVFPISSFSASPATVDVGIATNLSVSASGGVGTLSYFYAGLPPGCPTANVSTLSCTPSSYGNFDVKVFVNDTKGNSANATTTLVVDPTPSVSAVASSNPTDADVSSSFSATTSGGTGPFNYTWIFNSTSRAYGPRVSHSFPAAGNYTIRVYSNDSFGLSANTNYTVRVYPELNATLTSSNSTPLLGQTVAFVANVTGGLGPYNYSYSGFPPGCVSENKPAIGCLPTQADYYNVTVHVRDQNNVTVSSTVTVHVIFDFNVIVPTNTSAGSPFTISVNTNETFSGGTAFVPAAGFGAFTYNYTGLPPGCASEDASSITCTPTQAGTYHITINVHDQVGDHQTHTVVVNVVPAGSSSSGPALFSGTVDYAIIGGLVAIVAIAAVLIVTRSRRRTRD